MRALIRILWITGIFFGLGYSTSFAGPLEQFYIQKQQREQMFQAGIPRLQAQYFTQRLDAENPDKGSFQQRYYVDNSFAKDENSPVFFYICGQASCEESSLGGAIRNYAERFNARLVALEHRYYGKSLPFDKLSTKNLRYLNTEAALNDLAYFQRQMQKENGWTGKWIAFGGSYPGSLAAYYRLKYPYLVAGAVASSAPVKAKEDFNEYDRHVARVSGRECVAKIRNVISTFEIMQTDPEAAASIKRIFGAEDIENNVDFLNLLAEVASFHVQFGMEDHFCPQLIQSDNPMKAYAAYTKSLLRMLGIRAVDLTPQAAMSETIENPNGFAIGMRQWYYQSCTEYGHCATAYPNRHKSTRSSQLNMNYCRQICQRLFNLKQGADTQKINSDFYTPLQSHLTRNIVLTNGSRDPWSKLSLTPKTPDANNDNLDYLLIKGAAHCEDMHQPSSLDSKALREARAKIVAALEKWLA